MKIGIHNLSNVALAWAVARVEGIPAEELYAVDYGSAGSLLFRRLRDDEGNLTDRVMTGSALLFDHAWEAAGPIIERNRIELHNATDGRWVAHAADGQKYGMGDTPIVAAMRCHVLCRLGAEVEIPDNVARMSFAAKR